MCFDKCVSIIVKIKCVNFDNISDTCDRNRIFSYTHFTTTDTFYQNTHKIYNFLHRHKNRFSYTILAFTMCFDKCVSIIVKIKCVNSDNISDTFYRNRIFSYTHFTRTDTFYQNTHKIYNFLHFRWDSPATGPKYFQCFL